MIRAAVFVAASLVAAAAPAAELRFPVGDFDRIALGGSPDVVVTTGKAVSVVASGDQKALDRLEIRVVDGALKIGTKQGMNWSWGNYGKVSIVVTVPMVRGIEIGGSGTVTVDRIKVPQFSAEVGGSGSVKVGALDVQTASFTVGGSGDVAASGRCGDARASVGGSGNARLAGLQCATLVANVGGSGDIDAYASRSATLSLAGSGDIRVAGGAKCTISKSGSGQARCV